MWLIAFVVIACILDFLLVLAGFLVPGRTGPINKGKEPPALLLEDTYC